MSGNPPYERPTQPYGELAHSEPKEPKFFSTRLPSGMPATSIEQQLFAILLSVVRTVGPGSAFDDAQAGHIIRVQAIAIRATMLTMLDLRANIIPMPEHVRKELEQ